MSGIIMLGRKTGPMRLKRTMLFIDGENLAIRAKEMLKNGRRLYSDTFYKEDIYLWNNRCFQDVRTIDIVRANFYTSVYGDNTKIETIENDIAAITYNINAPGNYHRKARIIPKVFKKHRKSTKSRAVDMQMTRAYPKTFFDVVRIDMHADIHGRTDRMAM